VPIQTSKRTIICFVLFTQLGMSLSFISLTVKFEHFYKETLSTVYAY